MKYRIGSAALLASILCAAALPMAGCAVFGKGEPSSVTSTLQNIHNDYEQAVLQTEATQDALSELNISPFADLDQAYATFSDSVNGMQQIGKLLIRHADAMYFRGASYLVESEKPGAACVYPPVPKGGNQKAAELGSSFDAIADQSWEVKRAFRDFQFDISQLQDTFSKDRTHVGDETFSFIVEKTRVDGESLKESLWRALAALERARAEKSPAANGG